MYMAVVFVSSLFYLTTQCCKFNQYIPLLLGNKLEMSARVYIVQKLIKSAQRDELELGQHFRLFGLKTADIYSLYKFHYLSRNQSSSSAALTILRACTLAASPENIVWLNSINFTCGHFSILDFIFQVARWCCVLWRSNLCLNGWLYRFGFIKD